MFDHSARRVNSQPYESSNDVTVDENVLVSEQLEVQQMGTVLETNDEPEQTKEEMLLGKVRGASITSIFFRIFCNYFVYIFF